MLIGIILTEIPVTLVIDTISTVTNHIRCDFHITLAHINTVSIICIMLNHILFNNTKTIVINSNIASACQRIIRDNQWFDIAHIHCLVIKIIMIRIKNIVSNR